MYTMYVGGPRMVLFVLDPLSTDGHHVTNDCSHSAPNPTPEPSSHALYRTTPRHTFGQPDAASRRGRSRWQVYSATRTAWLLLLAWTPPARSWRPPSRTRPTRPSRACCRRDLRRTIPSGRRGRSPKGRIAGTEKRLRQNKVCVSVVACEGDRGYLI